MLVLGNVTYTGERRNESNVSVGKLSGKRALLRPNRRWTDSIKKLHSVKKRCESVESFPFVPKCVQK